MMLKIILGNSPTSFRIVSKFDLTHVPLTVDCGPLKKLVNNFFKHMKTLKQLMIACQQSVISCINEREAFYRSVIIKVIGTKPVKESSVWDDDYFSESSTSDTISAMFEW